MSSSSFVSAYGADFGFGTSTAVEAIPAGSAATQALNVGLNAAPTSFDVSGAGLDTLYTATGVDLGLVSPDTIAAMEGMDWSSGFDWSTDVFGAYLGFATEAPPLGGEPGIDWNFVVAPEDISWDISMATNRVDMFGTNAPPVTVGTKGMRELTLSNAMVEGFTRGRTVEGRLLALEKLMRFSLNSEQGFVNVPVYQVFAGEKDYGNANDEEGGCFVLKDIKVKETMRDLSGWATRAFVDVSFIQVPKYQVNTGVDQASTTVSGATSVLGSQTATSSTTAPTGGVSGQASQTGSTSAPPPPPDPAPKPPATPSPPPPVIPGREIPLF